MNFLEYDKEPIERKIFKYKCDHKTKQQISSLLYENGFLITHVTEAGNHTFEIHRRGIVNVIGSGDCGDIIVLEIGPDVSDVYVYTDEEFQKRYYERVEY